jgi:hypothetical protein
VGVHQFALLSHGWDITRSNRSVVILLPPPEFFKNTGVAILLLGVIVTVLDILELER